MTSEHDPAGVPPRPADGSGEEPLVAPAAEPDTQSGDTAAAGDAVSGAEMSGAPAAGVDTSARSRLDSHNMLPGRERRRSGAERLLVRLIATCGIVAIGVAIAAIMVSSKSQGWLVGLVVSIVSVALAAVLWSSRQL